jgi:hypothetical protein
VRLPDFLIVGAMKAGTTTLADYLDQHAGLYMPSRELQFFNRDDRYARGLNYYSELLLEDFSGGEVLVGEKTPTYSYQENCAERIWRAVPDAKLIWVFRNPAERAFSNYLHAVRNGSEYLSFEGAVVCERERMAQDIFKGYVERSKYVEQVERFLQWFDRAQMHFVLFEDLLRQRDVELNRISSFLGVESFGSEVLTKHSNKAVFPFSPRTLYWARGLFGGQGRMFKVVRKLNQLIPGEPPKVSPDFMAELDKLFEPYNERLADLTGLDLSCWQVRRS